MSSRSSKLVILGGFAVVLAIGIVLIVLTRSTTATSGETAPAPAPAASSPVATTTPAAPTTTAPHATTPPAQGTGRIAPTQAPTLAPGVEIGKRDLPRDENGHLIPVIHIRELRAQLGRTEIPMKACLAKASGVTGKATLAFTVAAKDGKLVVESTAVQDEETLAGYPDLLDCMHQTATALQPFLDMTAPANPGTAVYVRRHVRLDNGALAENSIFDFSYVP